MLRKLSFLGGIPLSLMLALLLADGALPERPPALVSGVVLDPHDAVIPGIRVQLGAQMCDSPVANVGHFICRVPEGVYTLTAESLAILPYRRAQLRLRGGEHRYIVVRPVFRAPSDGSEPDPDVKYVTAKIPGPAGEREVLIRCMRSTKPGGERVFEGPDLMLTIGELSFYADRLKCSRDLRKCVGSRNIRIEQGEERLEGAEVKVDLAAGAFVLRREAEVMRRF
jgi:hypothetical protein